MQGVYLFLDDSDAVPTFFKKLDIQSVEVIPEDLNPSRGQALFVLETNPLASEIKLKVPVLAYFINSRGNFVSGIYVESFIEILAKRQGEEVVFQDTFIVHPKDMEGATLIYPLSSHQSALMVRGVELLAS